MLDLSNVFPENMSDEEKHHILNGIIQIIVNYCMSDEFIENELDIFLPDLMEMYGDDIDIDLIRDMICCGINSAANALATEAFKLLPPSTKYNN